MSERSYEIWIYNQLHPHEKSYGGGKKQLPNHSFLKPLPEHLVGRGPKKIIRKDEVIPQDENIKKT